MCWHLRKITLKFWIKKCRLQFTLIYSGNILSFNYPFSIRLLSFPYPFAIPPFIHSLTILYLSVCYLYPCFCDPILYLSFNYPLSIRLLSISIRLLSICYLLSILLRSHPLSIFGFRLLADNDVPLYNDYFKLIGSER